MKGLVFCVYRLVFPLFYLLRRFGPRHDRRRVGGGETRAERSGGP